MFAPASVGPGTNFDNALFFLNAAFAGQPLGETNVAFFLSDGAGTLGLGGGSPLARARAAGTVVHTFSIGPLASGCAPGAQLRTIADATRGTCTEVPDPSLLVSMLPAVRPALLDRVEVNGTVVPTNALGDLSAVVACPGDGPFTVTVSAFSNDPDRTMVSADVTLHCILLNADPICEFAAPSIAFLGPPNHKLRPVDVLGVVDPDGDPVTITITDISQDEPVDGLGDGNSCPDAAGVGGPTALLRSERAGSPRVPGDGRVYDVSFHADDGLGGQCAGTISVCVPHDRGRRATCIDQGPLFESTRCE